MQLLFACFGIGSAATQVLLPGKGWREGASLN
jgi:hypothetical protein